MPNIICILDMFAKYSSDVIRTGTILSMQAKNLYKYLHKTWIYRCNNFFTG